MKNFTSVYLKRLKRKLLDNYGNSIQSIKYSDDKNENYFMPPCIEYDLMEIKRQLKTPILRESRDVVELKEEGLVLCSVPVTESTKFYPKQQEFLFITRQEQAPVGSITINSMLGNNKKAQHRLVFDEANRRVKLVGPGAGRLGEGPWILLEEN